MPIDKALTLSRLNKIQQNVDCGGLARTIGTQQAEDLARLDAISDMIQGQDAVFVTFG